MDSVDYLNPLHITDAWSVYGNAGAIEDLGTFNYYWPGAGYGHVWLSALPDRHAKITTNSCRLFIEGPLGVKTVGTTTSSGSYYYKLLSALDGQYGSYQDGILEPGWNELRLYAQRSSGWAGNFGTGAINLITIPYPVPNCTISPLGGRAPLTVQLEDTTLYLDSAVTGRYGVFLYRVVRGGSLYSEYYNHNQTVVLGLPGIYKVQIWASNDNGGTSKSEIQYINVLSDRRRAAAWVAGARFSGSVAGEIRGI